MVYCLQTNLTHCQKIKIVYRSFWMTFPCEAPGRYKQTSELFRDRFIHLVQNQNMNEHFPVQPVNIVPTWSSPLTFTNYVLTHKINIVRFACDMDIKHVNTPETDLTGHWSFKVSKRYSLKTEVGVNARGDTGFPVVLVFLLKDPNWRPVKIMLRYSEIIMAYGSSNDNIP